MKLYGYPMSRSTRALWALEEANALYDFVLVDLFKGEGRAPAFRAINPAGKVPVLVDDDLVLSESAAICTYVADQHPGMKLVPTVGCRNRARYNQWCFFAIGELEQPLWNLSKHQFALPEARRVPALLDTARWEFGVAVELLAQGLGPREFILGDQFSMADVLLAHTLDWATAVGLPLGSAAVEDYARRMLSRPALQRARACEKLALDERAAQGA